MFSSVLSASVADACVFTHHAWTVRDRQPDGSYKTVPASAWRRWLFVIAKTAGALLFVTALGLPVYLAFWTPVFWVDIAVCSFGTYFLSTLLLDFDNYFAKAEGMLWIWRRRFAGDDWTPMNNTRSMFYNMSMPHWTRIGEDQLPPALEDQ